MAALSPNQTHNMFPAGSCAARALIVRIFLVVIALPSLALLQSCGEHQADHAFGLELRKPSSWTFVSGGVGAAHGDVIDYTSAAVAQAIASPTAAPLFALLKRPPPQVGMNPSFGINLARDASIRGQSPMALLAAEVARASKSGQFLLTQAVTASKLAGHDAAQAELRTAADKLAGNPTVRVRLHLLIVDDVSLLIATTDSASGLDAASAEFTQILASLRLPGAP